MEPSHFFTLVFGKNAIVNSYLGLYIKNIIQKQILDSPTSGSTSSSRQHYRLKESALPTTHITPTAISNTRITATTASPPPGPLTPLTSEAALFSTMQR
jgi:hypothetical protein